VLALALAACGSAAHRAATPKTVCEAAARAAGVPRYEQAGAAGATTLCRVRAGGVRVGVSVERTPRAYTEFDTTVSHYSQVFGNGPVHNSSDQPVPVPAVGGAAVWVAAPRQLVATTAQPGRDAGTYLTVTLSGRRGGGRRLAAAVARAVLRAAALPSPS
jgi:hypothetical protein